MWVQEVRVLDKVRHFEAGDWLEATQGEIGLVPSHGLHRLNLISSHLNLIINVHFEQKMIRLYVRYSNIQ